MHRFDLPVTQDQFEVVINLKNAGSPGIDVPAALSAQADEIIESSPVPRRGLRRAR